MFKFFHRSFNFMKDKDNRDFIKFGAKYVAVGGLSVKAYLDSSLPEKWVHSQMMFYYNRLPKEEQLAIERDPQKKQEFVNECQEHLRASFGPHAD